MKKTIFFLLIAIKMFAINCGDFTGEFKIFNGHYYAITGKKMSFQNAKNFAQANNGYLSIPNNIGENNFIKGIVGANNEAWIGIYDPNYTQSLCFTNNCYSTSRNRFKTIQGTNLSFQNWDSSDIENQFMKNDDTVDSMNKPIITLLGEHWALLSGNTGLWRDWGTHFFTGENPALQKAVIEFDTKPTCYDEPSKVTGEITGRVCNSQVWDTVLGVSDGTTAECLSDKNNIEYCPQSLAQCGQSWDYESGYSTSGIGQVVDYTGKVGGVETASKIQGYKSGIIGVAGNGLGYDGCVGGDRRSADAISYCASKGMRVPKLSETTGESANGVPSCGGVTLTSTRAYLEIKGEVRGSGYYNWNGTKVSQYTGNQNTNTYLKVRCVADNPIIATCPSGYTDNGSNCIRNTSACPSGYTETTGTETSKGQCKTNQNYTYYNYICSNGYTAINSGGNTVKTDPNNTIPNSLTNDLNSSSPPLNNCKKERFTCLSNPQRPCALVDNKMQCSPFPCVGSSDFENLGTVEGENDKNNSGWNNDGQCNGQLYIFNGEDKRCRLKDKFFGLTGGGCCDKDKVFMGLVACKDTEKILAKKRNNDVCHYVGNYCSKKLKFLGCIQTSESYCCFSSKLGKLIQEQGRPQLGISWGSGDSPNCRGFTPDEFQKLDFSKLDFTEFAKDIQVKTTNFNNIGGFIQNKVQGFFQK